MSVKYRDYYEVLGVPRDATAKAIRDAYRKLARQYHPDLQDTPAKKKVAEEKFKEINEAHEVLGDPEKRKKYNQLGSRWKDGMDFTPPPGSGHAGSWTWTGEEASAAVSATFSKPFSEGAAARSPEGNPPGTGMWTNMPVAGTKAPTWKRNWNYPWRSSPKGAPGASRSQPVMRQVTSDPSSSMSLCQRGYARATAYGSRARAPRTGEPLAPAIST